MKRAILACVVLACSVVSAAPVAAHAPPFWWMADMSGTSRVGTELTLGNPTLEPLAETTALGGSVFGEFALNPSVVLRGRLPLTFVFFDPAVGGEESEAAIGNFSIGVQAQAHHATGTGSVTMFGGGFDLYLPTASEGVTAGAARSATSQLYIPDLPRWFTDVTTARIRGDARIEAEIVFFQAELALDAQFGDDDGNDDDEIDLLVGIGPGIAVGPQLALMAELTVAEITDDELVTADIGLRYHDPMMIAGVRFYIPLSDPLREQDVFGVGMDIAARF